MPRRDLGLEFWKMTQKYGDLVYLNAFGKSMLVVGSYQIGWDLLEKRSANYSDRPGSVMAELTTFDRMFLVCGYGERWRLHRRVFHESFNIDAVSQFRPAQLNSARRFLFAILESRHDIAERLKFSVASNLIQVAYGIDMTEDNDDKYFDMVERISQTGEAIAFPILKYLPSWLPGGGFKTMAREAAEHMEMCVSTLYNIAVDGIVSMTSDAAPPGSDTMNQRCDTVFFLAMAMYPDAQRKAQEELDRVVGPDRLPDFSDMQSLPYLGALLKELLRWHVITPISLPHGAVADDTYNGYFIPAGTAVAVNGLARDPELYPDPDAFLPERYLDASGQPDPSKPDPSDWAFGFGRRICPGQHFAEASMFIYAASILYAFGISPPVDADGSPVELVHDTATIGVIAQPPFHDYVVRPRSAHAEQLVSGARRDA
ncbi:cytochrome P450 98A3 [Epithele typhae]|uniref:cytochrome P450 98A3 n=1 Tax=Epithele typhae TaxID=378194 RepID=UPI002007A411|nr:cytochrome P450 98A3 [Epithele typhae]KAH9926315.1 cytochrome P450 98A3 [Epithele typhae]